MRVYIRDVERNDPRGRPGWVVFWTYGPYDLRSAGRCYTDSAWEASLCVEARRLKRPVELQTVKSTLWERIQSVSLTEAKPA